AAKRASAWECLPTNRVAALLSPAFQRSIRSMSVSSARSRGDSRGLGVMEPHPVDAFRRRPLRLIDQARPHSYASRSSCPKLLGEEVVTHSRRERPEMISHRGAHRSLPENSIPAFDRAVSLGADAIERDVHAPSEGMVVVHHDAAIEAPGARTARIADLTAADLRRY